MGHDRPPSRRPWRVALLALASLNLASQAHTAEPLPVQEVAPGLFLHQGRHEEMTRGNQAGIANIGFIVGEEAVAVIDSGGSARQGARLRAAVRQVTDLPVRYVVNTHMHPDHIFGNAAFLDDGPRFVGHAKLARAMATHGPYYLRFLRETLGEDAAGTEIVPPDIAVHDRLELDLGNRILRLTAHPTAHSDNDMSVRDLRTDSLWLGDLLFTERLPVVDGSLKGWLAVLETLRGITAERVIPGHGAPSASWPAALDAQEEYLRALLSEIRAFIRDNRTMEEAVEEVGRSHRGRWLLYDDNHPRNVVTAFKELEWE